MRLDYSQGFEQVTLIIADTGNHRIRQLQYNAYIFGTVNRYCWVSCLSGLCGNNTLSATLNHFKATPYSGKYFELFAMIFC